MQTEATMDSLSHLGDDIKRCIREQDAHPGIYLDGLCPGTALLVETRNTTYTILVIGGEEVLIRGGRYFPRFVRAVVVGSTWGSPMVKLHYVGEGMHMEILTSDRRYTTSPVRCFVVGEAACQCCSQRSLDISLATG